MATRIGLGPVFALEWLTTTRRWQLYIERSLFVLALLLGLAGVWASRAGEAATLSIRGQARVGELFSRTIAGVQLAFVLLAAPAAAAGAICQDKVKGTLAHVLVTDLSDSEIVLGKLAARLVAILALVACTLPVTALGSLMGGIDPIALTGSFLSTIGIAILTCTLALTLSVWARKTSEALLATYSILMLWCVLPALVLVAGVPFGGALNYPPEWSIRVTPFFQLFGSMMGNTAVTLGGHVGYLVVMLLLSSGLIAVATLRVRAVAVRQAGGEKPGSLLDRPAKSRRRLSEWLPGPSLDRNPVLWREWHRNRPSVWSRVIWSVYWLLASVLTVASIVWIRQKNGPGIDFSTYFNGIQVAIGLLFLCTAAASSLIEERQSGSLEVLLSTPLPSRSIVLGKWWGAYRSGILLAILPGVIAAFLVPMKRHWEGAPLVFMQVLAYAAALTSLGLYLGTRLARPGWALPLCIGIYLCVVVLPVPVALIIWGATENPGPGVAAASPFFGTGYFTACIAGQGGPERDWPSRAAASIIWIVIYTTVAVVLYVLTLRMFDHRMGRIIERPQTPRMSDQQPDQAEGERRATRAAIVRDRRLRDWDWKTHAGAG